MERYCELDTTRCLFRSITHQPNVCTQRDAPAHDHDERHNSHARVGALTIHHPDWMDRHPSGSRQDTHGTLGAVRGEAAGGSTHFTGTSPSVTAQQNWRIKQPSSDTKSQHHACIDDHQFKEEEMGSVADLSKIAHKLFKMPVLGPHW